MADNLDDLPSDNSVIAETIQYQENTAAHPTVLPASAEIAKIRNRQAHNSGKESFAKWTVAALLVMAFLGAGTLLTKSFLTVGAEKTRRSIAVLPLKPIDSEKRDTIYELGIAESLIIKLSSVKNLTVRPLSATRQYLELDQNSVAAGQEQKVDYVLSSNYQVADGKIRVTAQLIYVESGEVVKSFKSEKDLAHIFSMQDAIANEIGEILAAKFGYAENNRAAIRGTTNEEAYRLYLQGTYILDQVDNENILKAVDHFEQAVKLDPNYAQAYAGLALAYRSATSKAPGSPQESNAKSKEAVQKALALDADLADAHTVLALIKASYD